LIFGQTFPESFDLVEGGEQDVRPSMLVLSAIARSMGVLEGTLNELGTIIQLHVTILAGGQFRHVDQWPGRLAGTC
jgi:hypothetical protein